MHVIDSAGQKIKKKERKNASVFASIMYSNGFGVETKWISPQGNREGQ